LGVIGVLTEREEVRRAPSRMPRLLEHLFYVTLAHLGRVALYYEAQSVSQALADQRAAELLLA